MSLEQRHELLGGFGDVERALYYLKQMIDRTYKVSYTKFTESNSPNLLRDEGLLEGLRLRAEDEDSALGLKVRRRRRQRRQRGRYRRVNTAMLQE